MRTIAFLNLKGGTAKTSSAFNVAAGLASEGKRVLIVDADPQGHLTLTAGIDTENCLTLSDLLIGKDVSVGDVIVKTGIDNLDIIPSDLSLAVADAKLSSMPAREFRLRSKLTNIEKYDYLLVDCPPSIGTIVMNVLCVVTEVIVPVSAGYFSLSGLNSLLDAIGYFNTNIGKIIGHSVDISGVFLTFHDPRTNVTKEVTDAINELFGDKLFEAKIPVNVKINEAQSHHKSIFDFEPKCKGAVAYSKLVQEILAMEPALV